MVVGSSGDGAGAEEAGGGAETTGAGAGAGEGGAAVGAGAGAEAAGAGADDTVELEPEVPVPGFDRLEGAGAGPAVRHAHTATSEETSTTRGSVRIVISFRIAAWFPEFFHALPGTRARAWNLLCLLRARAPVEDL